MSVLPLEELRTRIASGHRLLGIDLGEKTIGLALSDTLLKVATPYGTLKRGKFMVNVKELQAIATKECVGGYVIGLPLNMSGSDGPSAQSARAFARNLAGRSDLSIALWDERLSTAAVQRDMVAADVTRKRRSESVDKVAAAYILQSALEALRNLPLP
ncbi:MAG TPA: Holliday junction resolvase RuvX [Rhizomicrobium sp.]|nr:Holliday junction resolvase RuvX [Rhizomicrobium sp.]